MKDRSMMLPEQLKPLLLEHLEGVRIMHKQDLKKGVGENIEQIVNRPSHRK